MKKEGFLYRTHVLIPPLLIQPFIENSIIHGIVPKTCKGKVTVTFYKLPTNQIACEIIDDGIGRVKSGTLKSNNKSTHKSLFTLIIDERIKIFNTINNHGISFEIIDLYEDNVEAGTKIMITIPVISN